MIFYAYLAHSVKVAEDPTPPSNLNVKEQYTPSSSLLQDPLMKDFKSYVATKNKLKRKWGMSVKPECKFSFFLVIYFF